MFWGFGKINVYVFIMFFFGNIYIAHYSEVMNPVLEDMIQIKIILPKKRENIPTV